MSYQVSLAVIFLAVYVATVCGTNDVCHCNLDYKRIGCFKDKKTDRAMPEYILTDRSPRIQIYSGVPIDWQNWNSYMPGFICRCAEAARQKGHTYFGIQFYGECWSGPDHVVSQTYNMHGVSDSCVGKGMDACEFDERDCVGVGYSNAVFQLVDTECEVEFEKLGCYGDTKEDRAMADYVLSDRQQSLQVSSGQSIDWMNWNVFVPDFICRCAKKAKAAGRNVFGVQFYGECWTSVDAETRYHVHGERTTCKNDCEDPCQDYDTLCVGQKWTNAVYRIKADGLSCRHHFEPVGCFNEDASDILAGFELVNQINPSSSRFNGYYIMDADWDEEFPEFLCRCAWKTKEYGFSAFAVRNVGECWSGPSFEKTFDHHGASTECVTKINQTCTGHNCAGATDTNYVYLLM